MGCRNRQPSLFRLQKQNAGHTTGINFFRGINLSKNLFSFHFRRQV